MAPEQTHDNPTDEDTTRPVRSGPPDTPASQDNVGEAAPSEDPVTGGEEQQRPRIGPRILAVEAPSPPTPPVSKGSRAPRAPKPKPQQPRRRRRSPAERHRAVFFARLNELRRSGAPGADAVGEEEVIGEAAGDGASVAEPTADPPIEPPEADMPGQDAPVAEALSEQAAAGEQAAPAAGEQAAPAAGEQPASEVPPQTGPAQAARREASPPPVAPARVAAAIERVGGPEVVQEALAPKTDEQGERKKWAAVCCDAAQGSPPGDPLFSAWLRLAATPVREIKNHLPQPVDEGRAGRGRAGGPPRGGARAGRSDRGPQRDRPSRDEMANYARGGRLTTKVRIVDREQEKRERDQARKEQRERKRQAERERLDRLGY